VARLRVLLPPPPLPLLQQLQQQQRECAGAGEGERAAGEEGAGDPEAWREAAGSMRAAPLVDRARAATTSPREADGCTARPARIEGWPGDAILVDVSTAEAAKAPADEPRTACGPLGLNQGEQAFWRAGQGYGWFFSMGQDAFEIDPGSLTVIAKGADGRWAAL
jgi:hypothetical protein